MAKLPARFQDMRGYRLHWFRLPDGSTCSYRWREEEVEQKRQLLPLGAVEIHDPFRKGAPVGGYEKCAENHGVQF